MKLRRPTDFLILEALEETGRNVATNLGYETGVGRKHCNVRLPVLEEHGLVEKIGPAERSGLYQLTELGRSAIAHREDYADVDDWAARVRADVDGADRQPIAGETCSILGCEDVATHERTVGETSPICEMQSEPADRPIDSGSGEGEHA